MKSEKSQFLRSSNRIQENKDGRGESEDSNKLASF